MARDIEEPVERKRSGPGNQEELVFSHPAFAQIRASRVSGRINLYDSDFDHRAFVSITISRSELHRHLSRDWHHGREELIEVSMSEAQWASFVSSMNVGCGIPCTITRHDDQLIPGLPDPKDPSHLFKKELVETLGELQKKVKDLAAALDGPLSKSKATELRRQLELVARDITGSTGFVANQFDEHVEGTVERAKSEINAYALTLVQRAGLEALTGQIGGQAAPVISYLSHEEKSDGS